MKHIEQSEMMLGTIVGRANDQGSKKKIDDDRRQGKEQVHAGMTTPATPEAGQGNEALERPEKNKPSRKDQGPLP